MTPAPAVHIGKLVVVGVGLIGGSFALALRAAARVDTIVGVGRTLANLDAAKARGAIDRGYTPDDDWTHEVADADLVLLATPVGQFPALLRALAPRLGPATVVTDAGSTKQDVVAAAREALGAALRRFVPAHPIAGSEQSGAGAADACLFVDRAVIVTPLPGTAPAALACVTAAWRATGARVTTLSPTRHDQLLAATSHLPHVLAFTLMAELAGRPDAAATFAHAGSGLRDFTRIAGSSPSMWRDIVLANRAAVQAELAAYRTALDDVSRVLDAGDAVALGELFARASAARREWSASAHFPRASAAPDDNA